MHPRLSDALHACRTAIGADRVGTDRTALDSANTATFATTAAAPAVLRPRDRTQVAACLGIAQEYRVPIYPVSLGRNWGYGSAVAPRDGCLLLSLADLNAIREFDADSGRVRLEPGVSFHQLHTFLRQHGSGWQPPHTGSGAHTSVVGNVLERGIGKGLYEDMVAHVLACEALLPTGEVLRTSVDNAGPAPFGLLPQGNLAVVVDITLQLEREPRFNQLLTFGLGQGTDGLLRALAPLRALAQRDGPRLQQAFLNDYRIASQVGRFPRDTHDGSQALPRAALQSWLEPWQGAQWIGACTLWADDATELDWRRQRLITTLDALGLQPRVEAVLHSATQPLDDDGLRCAYWRKPFAMPTQPDLDRDRCGVVWLAPVVPQQAQALAGLLAQLEATTLTHGLEPAMALRAGRVGAPRLILGLFYDRDRVGADNQVLACRAALQAVLHSAGLHCYRHTVLDPSASADPTTQTLMAALKRQFDPYNILAPGRYHAHA
jgi:4-cresol dehydrogenase (hydroxylating)